MANIQMTVPYGVDTIIDRRWTPTDSASPTTVAEFAAIQDIQKLDAYLAAANAAYWTAARLRQESLWDKYFWLRSQTPAGLA